MKQLELKGKAFFPSAGLVHIRGLVVDTVETIAWLPISRTSIILIPTSCVKGPSLVPTRTNMGPNKNL